MGGRRVEFAETRDVIAIVVIVVIVIVMVLVVQGPLHQRCGHPAIPEAGLPVVL